MNSKEKAFWTEFLELYKSMPCLWNIKSPEYTNRKLKSHCYEKMIKKLKEIDAHANRDKVIKKINVFRTNYKRDLKKVKYSEKYESDDVFKSSLWYFDKLKFLDDHKCNGERKCTREIESFNKQARKITAPISSKKIKVSVEDNLLEIACQKLAENDEASCILAKGWAMQFKELSQEQKVLTRMIIADILFHGCLDKLTEKTVEDIHKVLKGFSVEEHFSHSKQTSNACSDDYSHSPSSQHFEQDFNSLPPEKKETSFEMD